MHAECQKAGGLKIRHHLRLNSAYWPADALGKPSFSAKLSWSLFACRDHHHNREKPHQPSVHVKPAVDQLDISGRQPPCLFPTVAQFAGVSTLIMADGEPQPGAVSFSEP